MERQHDSHMQYPFFTLKICVEKKVSQKKKTDRVVNSSEMLIL